MKKFFKNIFSVSEEFQRDNGLFIKRYTCIRFLGLKIKTNVKYINGDNNLIQILNEFGEINTVKNIKEIKGLTIVIEGNNNTVRLTKPLNFYNCKIIISGNNNCIEIGRQGQAFIQCSIKLLKGYNGRKLLIGDNFSLRSGEIILDGEDKHIFIGNDVMCSENISFRTTDSHKVIDISTGEHINPDNNIEIGNHVWITKDVIVSKGTKIPDNCIIGTRAFVNKQFNIPNSMIAGIPAKIVKSNVNWV